MTIKIQVVAMDVHQLELLNQTMFAQEVLQQQRILELLEELDFIQIQESLLEKLIEETD